MAPNHNGTGLNGTPPISAQTERPAIAAINRNPLAGDACPAHNPFNAAAAIVKLSGVAGMMSMSRCTLVAAIAAALVFAGSAILGNSASAADQQDYVKCRGSDATAAMASCSAIIADRHETADNRADAYSRRAAARLQRGAIDAAIADFSAAIELQPQNIASYVARAVAYFRNGDRDRAVIDFAVAERFDAEKTDEIGAANPAFAQIAALARSVPPAAAAPGAAASTGPFCPTGATAGDGFVLVNAKTDRRQQVDPSSGDVATYEYFEGGARAMSATYYKGLLVLFASFLDTYVNSYDIDYTRLGNYQIGQQTLYHASHLTLDGTVSIVTVRRRIAAQEKLVIGDCSFDTFVIESQSQFPDGTKTVARANFSPALRMSLRYSTTTEGAQPYEVSYDRIEPLNRP
jgi:tetratricopeptide (TPR) repeat protein